MKFAERENSLSCMPFSLYKPLVLYMCNTLYKERTMAWYGYRKTDQVHGIQYTVHNEDTLIHVLKSICVEFDPGSYVVNYGFN